MELLEKSLIQELGPVNSREGGDGDGPGTPVDCRLSVDVVHKRVDRLSEGDFTPAISDEDDEGEDDYGNSDTCKN